MVANNYINHSVYIDVDWYLNHGYMRTDWVSENIMSALTAVRMTKGTKPPFWQAARTRAAPLT